MDLFKDFMRETIDLDNLDVYPQEWKDISVHDLFLKCMAESGTSLFYMKFLHKDFDSQQGRVDVLCEELAKIWHFTRQFDRDAKKCTLVNEDEYRLALMKWLYRFQDETENQC